MEWLTAQLDADERDADPEVEVRAVAEHALRTIAAHRAILERYKTAIVSRDVAVGTLLAGATRMSLRIHEESARLIAAIYQDRPGFDPSWKVETSA